jgi:hypothetical protein
MTQMILIYADRFLISLRCICNDVAILFSHSPVTPKAFNTDNPELRFACSGRNNTYHFRNSEGVQPTTGLKRVSMLLQPRVAPVGLHEVIHVYLLTEALGLSARNFKF